LITRLPLLVTGELATVKPIILASSPTEVTVPSEVVVHDNVPVPLFVSTDPIGPLAAGKV
jgi:hypothetical protein